jgi:hypothetical protein
MLILDKRILLPLLIGSFTFALAYADDFRLHPKPTQPSGREEIPYKKPEDPKVCAIYLQNLRFFARKDTRMSCERPIAPQLGKAIQKVEWEELSPDNFPDLFRSIVAKHQHWNTNPPKDETNELRNASKAVRERLYAFRRVKLPVEGFPDNTEAYRPPVPKQTFWYVQYGPNTADPKNPNPILRCDPARGGRGPRPITSDLKIYLVSQDMKTVFQGVVVPHNGSSGEALRLINSHPYFETATSSGNVVLMEPDRDYPWILEPVCLYQFTLSRP